MCLQIESATRVAKEDIKCYKLVYRANRTDPDQRFISEWRRYRYEIRDQKYRLKTRFMLAMAKIPGGPTPGFYSFKYLDSWGIQSYYPRPYDDGGPGVVIECVIPKGALYTEGMDGASPSYRSSSIRLVRVIPWREIPRKVRLDY